MKWDAKTFLLWLSLLAAMLLLMWTYIDGKPFSDWKEILITAACVTWTGIFVYGQIRD